MKPQQFWGTEKPVLIVDIDGTLCTEDSLPLIGGVPDYAQAKPFTLCIDSLKTLQDSHFIVLWTARYEADLIVTENWLWGNEVPYDRLILGKKPYDMFIDANSCKTPCQFVKELENLNERPSN